MRLTIWARDDGAALVRALLDRAVLADGLGERAYPEVAHQHAVVARAVEARLIRHDSVPLPVVLEVVVASLCRAWNIFICCLVVVLQVIFFCFTLGYLLTLTMSAK